jgi:DNA/RNA endonuclease YhcR with UshA esterase domain
MFWKKKKKVEIPKQALILQTYLSGCTVLIDGRTISPAAKAGIQVFVLGMTDMLRQAENLSWEECLAIYGSILSQYKILPSQPVDAFVDSIGGFVSSNENIAKVMRMGAQSITMYVSEHDANAPIDLLSVVPFAENNQDSFQCLF